MTTAPPNCAWHPDRPTWVSCSRCERPICPDCMNEAPVGFHCPACIAEGKRTVRQIKVRTARVTSAIIAACVVVFLLGTVYPNLWLDFGVAGYFIFDLAEYHRLVTATFLHAGLLHLAFNMFTLAQIGPRLEGLLGSTKFAAVYAFSGIGGSIASVLFNDPFTVSVGASGAIFGVVGSLIVVLGTFRFETAWITTLIGINLLIGFVVPGIDWHAHLGGLLAGALVTLVIHRLFPNWGRITRL